MTKITKIMTPDHHRWSEFYERLGQYVSRLGCSGNGTQLDDAGKITPQDPAQPTHWLSQKLLIEMGCDVDASLEYFREHGGYCDCEVLFNVEEGSSAAALGG